MKEVFISYESSNQKQAEKLVEVLEDKRYDCWIATRDVPKGEPYDDYIPEAIVECKIVVMLFSKASLASPHVKKELRIAVKHDKKIIPFMLEDVELTAAFEYHIESNNRISADKDWDKAVEELLRSMKHENVETSKAQIAHDESTKEQLIGSQQDTKHKSVCCPHCGCTVLKRERYFVDRYLYSKRELQDGEDILMWLLKHRDYVLLAMVIVFVCMVVVTLVYMEKLGQLFLPYLGVFGICVWCTFAIANKPDIKEDLIDTIERSDLKYYTFKCARCENAFSILLPKQSKLKDLVPDLLERKIGS